MAYAHDIETAESAFLVGKRRPLTDFPVWKQWVIRAVYFLLGWDNGQAIEVQSICTTKELAQEMASKPGWFLIRLPINTSLPDEPCQFKEHEFPASGVHYQHTAPLAAVSTAEIDNLKKLDQQVDELVRKVRAG
jgi:hypothetical protein